MNGCDRANQQVQYYGMHKPKMNKWWKKIVHFLLELTVINASIINNTKRLAIGMKKLELVNLKNMLIQKLTEAACIERQEAPREIHVPKLLTDSLLSHIFWSRSKKTENVMCAVDLTTGKGQYMYVHPALGSHTYAKEIASKFGTPDKTECNVAQNVRLSYKTQNLYIVSVYISFVILS